MKEGRILIIGSVVLSILIAGLASILNFYLPNKLDYYEVARNLYYGLFMSFLTGICQYCVAKRRIINNIYGYYFDIYRTYYYSKKRAALWHYNSYCVYKKLVELNSTVNEQLDEYHGLFRKRDKTYKKLNPNINLGNNYDARNLEKSFFIWFNKKHFEKAYVPLIAEIKSILISINKARFEKDKKEMLKMYSYLWNENKIGNRT